jgi:hypothetical protein
MRNVLEPRSFSGSARKLSDVSSTPPSIRNACVISSGYPMTDQPERLAHYEKILGKSPRRGLTAQEAAEHCGMSVGSFHAWLKRQGIACRIPGTQRYDLKALDAAIDKLMGIVPPTAERKLTPYEAWKAKR